MIIVLDTNVLVSGIINPHGPPGRIVDLLRAGELRLAVDDRILSEYTDVLRRPRLASYFAGQDVEHILEYLRGNSERLIATTHIVPGCRMNMTPLSWNWRRRRGRFW